MIGFNELGRKGNLGNQLFQFAALRGIAANRGYTWQMPPEDSTRVHDYAIQRLFSLNSITELNVGYSPFETYLPVNGDGENSTDYHFDSNFFNNCPDNVNINGFFQSEKYFKHISSKLKADLQFKQNFIDLEIEKLSQFDYDFIALHIRRGDYLHFPEHHPVLDTSYYIEALADCPDLPIVVFTNDKDWVLKSKFLDKFNYIVSDFSDYGHDLYLMTKAKKVIIANSSFSWWGAWLSDATEIFAPKKWFGPKLSHQDTSDLYPENWKLI
jgi:hypothetical protein